MRIFFAIMKTWIWPFDYVCEGTDVFLCPKPWLNTLAPEAMGPIAIL